jgi:mediator of RNA polymerase II transcription subunit 6
MQQRFNTLDISDDGLLGSSYELWHYSDSLFVIKQLHKTLNSVTLTGVYYIVQGTTIYKAPTLAKVLKSRLTTALYHLQSAFEQCISSNNKI